MYITHLNENVYTFVYMCKVYDSNKIVIYIQRGMFKIDCPLLTVPRNTQELSCNLHVTTVTYMYIMYSTKLEVKVTRKANKWFVVV